MAKKTISLNSSFSVEIARLITDKGYTVSDALKAVIGGITDGSGPRTTAVLEDLQTLGAFNPKPSKVRYA